MRILVRMPNWIGDAVMATPAVENLREHFPRAGIVLLGSEAVSSLFESDPRFAGAVVDRSKAHRFRPAGIKQQARSLVRRFGTFEIAVAFPNSLSSRLLLRLLGANHRVGARRGWHDVLLTHAVPTGKQAHQAEVYNQIINGYLGTQYEAGRPRLHVSQAECDSRPTFGINPGAAYGSAKRWLPERFAQVAGRFAGEYDILVFGSPGEAAMAAEIEQALRDAGVSNYRNLAGRTSVSELVGAISGLSLFITNDSGPMHIAGALEVPTVAIFGSTDHLRTHPWRHLHCKIVRHELPCAPCLKRTCPLGHHACMQDVTADEVYHAARNLLESLQPGSTGDAAAA